MSGGCSSTLESALCWYEPDSHCNCFKNIVAWFAGAENSASDNWHAYSLDLELNACRFKRNRLYFAAEVFVVVVDILYTVKDKCICLYLYLHLVSIFFLETIKRIN